MVDDDHRLRLRPRSSSWGCPIAILVEHGGCIRDGGPNRGVPSPERSTSCASGAPWFPEFEDSLRGGVIDHQQKVLDFPFLVVNAVHKCPLNDTTASSSRLSSSSTPFQPPDREFCLRIATVTLYERHTSSDTTVLQAQLERELWTSRIENLGDRSWTHHRFTANRPARFSTATASRWGETMARSGVLMGQSSLRFQSLGRLG